MNKDTKTKEEIFEQTIMKNIRRKSRYIDQVQMVDGVPLFSWIDINPTELCNRKCEFCPRRDPAEYPNQNLHMQVAMAKRIVDELRSFEYRGGIIFSGHGEPLLHNDIVGLVGAFGSDIHTELVTCGDKLSVELVKELFAAGLGVLLVSMYDGPHQVDKFKKMFAEAGLNSEQYVLRDRWYGVEEDYGVKLTNRAGTVREGHQVAFDKNRPCYYTHYSLQIDWNGDVLLCVQDFNKKIKFGNLYAQSLLDIWKSRNISRYRRVLGKGRRVIYPCDRCNVNGTLHGRKHLEAWDNLHNSKRSE
jgi:radical SAM protein with 4Fe4S-binding SPASM domain